jgi:hypothetical protein
MSKFVNDIMSIGMAGTLWATNVVAEPIANPLPISFKPYGYVKLDAAYDSTRTANGDYMWYVLPKVEGKSDDEFNMTARETRFGMDLTGSDVGTAKTTGKIEGDFYGPGGTANSPNLRLRLAYLDVAMINGFSVRAGQDWDAFMTVSPKMINFGYLADAGALGLRRPQCRITQEMKVGASKLIAKVAAARTVGEDIDGGGHDDGADSGRPTVQGNLVFETKLLSTKAAKIGISGHWGTETVDTSISNKITRVDSKDYDTWSAIGSLYFPVLERVAFQGSVWQGENLDIYYGGIGQGINKDLEREIGAQGGWAQVVMDLTECINFNVGYGWDNPDDADLNKNNRTKNEMVFTSIYYKLNSAATLAFEYSNMTTYYKGADKAENNRFQGSAIYKF